MATPARKPAPSRGSPFTLLSPMTRPILDNYYTRSRVCRNSGKADRPAKTRTPDSQRGPYLGEHSLCATLILAR